MSSGQRQIRNRKDGENGSRKQKSTDAGSSASRGRNEKRSWLSTLLRIQLYAMLLVAVVSILFWLRYGGEGFNVLHSNVGTGRLQEVEPANRQYAVMFDAGSTGTRILVFTFNNGSYLRLLGEYFHEEKPGISAYKADPTKAGDSVRGLLEGAKDVIPVSQWNRTPVALKATAGLRLLPEETSTAILREVQRVLNLSGLAVTIDEPVSIMDGLSEGLYSWFTVNFLLERIQGDLAHDSVATLDLGGGSTQVAFAPSSKKTIKETCCNHIHDINVRNRTIPFYIHSYLGHGLMAARLGIFQASRNSSNSDNNTFVTPCFDGALHTTFGFGGVSYTVRGPSAALEIPAEVKVKDRSVSASYYHCRQLAKTYVRKSIVPIPELQYREIYAMSYYFDRAVEAGFIDPYEGGDVPVSWFCDNAKDECSYANNEQPFACVDNTFICALLRDGYGLETSKVLHLKKKIHGHETSWALGAAIQLFRLG